MSGGSHDCTYWSFPRLFNYKLSQPSWGSECIAGPSHPSPPLCRVTLSCLLPLCLESAIRLALANGGLATGTRVGHRGLHAARAVGLLASPPPLRPREHARLWWVARDTRNRVKSRQSPPDGRVSRAKISRAQSRSVLHTR